jgi:hypothetical protein
VEGDTVGLLLDFTLGAMYVYKNGEQLGGMQLIYTPSILAIGPGLQWQSRGKWRRSQG